MSAHDNSKPPLRDRIIPWYFVMAFLVVFAVNALFIVLATGTHTGLVTEDPYEKGLDYNRIVAETKRQQQRAP